jgi:hypothetical protein
MAAQGFGDLLGGRPDVDEEGCLVGNVSGDRLGDSTLLIQTQDLTGRVGDVLHIGGQTGSPVVAPQQSLQAQSVDVAPDGLGGYVETLGELFVGDETVALDQR